MHKKTEVDWPWCKDLEIRWGEAAFQVDGLGGKEVSGQNKSLGDFTTRVQNRIQRG